MRQSINDDLMKAGLKADGDGEGESARVLFAAIFKWCLDYHDAVKDALGRLSP